jgi:hypothetical protein
MLKLDPDLAAPLEDLAAARVHLEEAVAALRSLRDGISADPGRLEEIDARLDALTRDVFRHFALCFADLLAANRSARERARLLASVAGEAHLDDPLADVDEAEVAVSRGPGVDDRYFALLNVAALVDAEGISSRARRVDVRGEQDSHPRSLQEAERVLRAVHEGERRHVPRDSAAVGGRASCRAKSAPCCAASGTTSIFSRLSRRLAQPEPR